MFTRYVSLWPIFGPLSPPCTFLQLSRPMRRFWAARRGTYIIYEELVSWPAQAWGVGWGCLFLDFNQPSLPCGLHSTYHPLRPGSLQWTRCPNSQSDPGKLQPILPKPFEKKQIPSSSDINERDRRWPEDHRDAGPSDRYVEFLVQPTLLSIFLGGFNSNEPFFERTTET